MAAEGTTKEKLMAAAHVCLLRHGYAGATIRELITESGTNQASINYHFGSKEVLLNRALFELNARWGEVLFGAVSGDALSATERWQRIIDSIQTHRALWFLNFEAITLAQQNPTVRAGLAERGAAARTVLAAAFGGPQSTSTTHAVGSHHYAQLIGVAAQWLIDPETAPSAAEIASGAQGLPD